MRVLSGKYKGRSLKYDHKLIRPTSSKLKESICSILYDEIQNALVLDLCCGSGAVTIELISRGAKEAYGIDKNLKIALHNKKQLGLDNFYLLRSDAKKAIENFAKKEKKFDIIYVDPPYLDSIQEDLLLKISKFDILHKKGTLLLENDSKQPLSDQIGQLYLQKKYQYGQTSLRLYRYCD